jgi:hypothetical protein
MEWLSKEFRFRYGMGWEMKLLDPHRHREERQFDRDLSLYARL